MNRFPARRLRRSLYSGLFVLALIVSLSGPLDSVLAADDSEANATKNAQDEAVQIPGSFKDLPDARDAVTAKRSAHEILPVTQSSPASAQLVIDSEKIARTGDTEHADSEMVNFHATAYCLKGRTASGVHTRPGIIAADPRVLPLGTVVHLKAGRYTGTYTVMDTGGRIKGRLVDVYVPTYREAREFGRRQVKIKVIGRNSSKVASKSLLAGL
jgi:3D (Asp-Asp-Asp) domain-containing protein